ncbi:MAG: squalene synthase HpnC [Sphingomonadaceae bacterium]
MAAERLASGKGHGDENFPVASRLIAPRHRAAIMAFYAFARLADDIADNPAASPAEKLALLGEMRATIEGRVDTNPQAFALRRVCAERGLDTVHASDLLTAFERDVTTHRTADYPALLDYCRYSAMPVGRFVLDVHGEARTTWPASDALCAALQIINHTQDCAKDLRAINRVYLPTDRMAALGATLDDLSAPAATPALRALVTEMAQKCLDLLRQSTRFADLIADRRLAAEVAVIHRLAVSLTGRLLTRDPLSQRVHHTKLEAGTLALLAAAKQYLKPRR